MKEWIVLTVVVSLASSILTLVLPENSGKKSFSVLCAVITVYVFFLPFAKGEFKLSDFEFEKSFDYSREFSEKSADAVELALKEGFEKSICEKLGEIEERVMAVSVYVISDDESYKVKRVDIYLSEKSEKEEIMKKEIYEIILTESEINFIEKE